MSLKRTLALAAVTAVAITSLAACAPQVDDKKSGDQTGVDLTKITVNKDAAAQVPPEVSKAGKIIIGVDPTYAPNEFKDKNGKPIGWEVDLMNAAAKKLGLETEYRVAKFDNIVPSILGEKYDLGIGGYYDSKMRQETMDIIDFFKAGNQFASPKDKPITEELQVCGMKVGAQNGGSAILDYLPTVQKKCDAAGKGKIEILGYDTQDEQTAALTLGRADAMVSDSPVTSYAVKLSKGKLVGSPIYDEVLSGAIVKKDRGEFAEALRAAVQDLSDDGTYSKLLQYWGVEQGAIDKITINAATK